MRSLLLIAGLALFACSQESGVNSTDNADGGATISEKGAAIEVNPNKNAYFGDTHVHTNLSFDAYLMGTRRTPDEAYEFAKGAAIEHASGFKMQMKKPLDFLEYITKYQQ